MPNHLIRMILTGDSKSAVKALLETGAAADKTAVQLERTAAVSHKTGLAFANLGKQIGAVGLVVALKQSVQAAGNYQDALTLIETQAHATKAEVASLHGSLMGMAPQVGQTAESLAKAIYPIESVGLHGKAALDALRAAAKGAAVGHSDLATTSSGVASAMKNQLKDVHSASDAMSIMNNVVGSGKMKLEDLNAAMSTGFLATVSNVKVGFRDIGSAIASMTAQGIPAQDEATRLKLTLLQMAAPHGAAAKGFANVGLSVTALKDDMAGPGGLIAALKHVQEVTAGPDQLQKLAAMFGGARGTGNMLALLKGIPEMIRIKKETEHSGAKQLDEAFQTTRGDFNQKVKEAKASIDNLKIALGEALLPTIAAVVSAISNLVTWFQKHKTETHILIGALGMLAAGYVATKVAAKADLIMMGVRAAAMIAAIVVTGDMASASILLGAAITAAGGPITVAIVAIAALAAGLVYAYHHCKTFRDIVDTVFGWLKTNVPKVVGFVIKHWRLLTLPLTAPFQLTYEIVKRVIALAGKIPGIVKSVTHAVSGPLSSVIKGVSDPVGTVESIFKHDGGVIHPRGFSVGGHVSGVGTSDTVPAMLTPGEFVMRRQAVQALGVGNLTAINQSGSMVMAGGGGDREIVIPIKLTMGNERVLAEAVTRYSLKMAARR